MRERQAKSATSGNRGALRRAALLGMAGALLALSLGARADLEEIRCRGYLTVATEDNYAPYNFMTDGKPDGFHKDLLQELQTYARLEVRQDILPWTGLLAAVVGGKYDFAFTGALVTDERLRVFDFAPPFASAQHYFIRRADDDRLDSIASLSGRKLGVQAGSALLSRLPELERMLAKTGGELGEVVEYQSYPEAYADLANGRLDYVIDGVVSVNDLVRARPGVFAKGLPVSADGYAAWPVPKNSPELLAFLTRFLDHARASGRLAELQRKWYGQEFPGLPAGPITSAEQFHRLAGIE